MVPGMPPPGSSTASMVQPIMSLAKPLPNLRAATTKYYTLTVPNSSMHRTDGMRLAFVNKVHETDIQASQDYLDGELLAGHPYLRVSTEEEVAAHKMSINPRAAIREELQRETEIATRQKLTEEIMETLRRKGIEVPVETVDELKLQGTDSTNRLLDSIAKGIPSGTGTLVPSSPIVDDFSMQRSIVGSDKSAGNMAGSSSTTTVSRS